MKRIHRKKNLHIFLLLLIAVLTLGIGYAAITSVNLFINGDIASTPNQDKFRVHFIPTDDTPDLVGNVDVTGNATIDDVDDTVAHLNVSGLTKVGDCVTAIYTVKNDSNSIGTKIKLNIENSNTEYFNVIEIIDDDTLQEGETTTVSIIVGMKKTPITNDVSTNITGTLTASPLENDQATGSEGSLAPYIFTPWNYNNKIGEPIMMDGVLDFNEVTEEFGHPAAIAHSINPNTMVIKESYLAFERNGVVYYLKSNEGYDYDQEDKPIFEDNVNTLKTAYGPNWENYCSEEHYDNDYDGNNDEIVFSCENDDGSSIGTNSNGYVGAEGAGQENWWCEIYNDGISDCAKWQ